MNLEHIKFLEIIEQQLADKPFTIGGVLQKYVVISKARNADEELLALLLQNDDLREKFFPKVAGVRVFNTAAFVWYLEQKNYLNDSYTQYKNKVGLTIDGKYLRRRNEVALVWPFKDCCLEGGQSKEEGKRDEVFFNEVLAQDEITQLLWPKALTEAAVHDKTGGRQFKTFTRNAGINKARDLPADTITDNLLIQGNNLLALHSLKKQFAGKVKLIYIDPPYNTGGDANIFTYNNTFNHSTWLTFMRNRLEVAKEMLRDDGFIAIAIDHVELFYLGVLADEIFGRENRLGIVSVKHHPAGRTFNDEFFATTNEYMIVFSKEKNLAVFNKFPMPERTKQAYNMEDEVSKYKLDNIMRKGETRNARRQDRPKQFYPIYMKKEHIRDFINQKNLDIDEVLPIDKRK